MASLFEKDPSGREPLPAYSRDRIEKEIAHLKKGTSTRTGAAERKTIAKLLSFVLILAVIWLYIMDPIFYSYEKGDAIRAYTYLHNYGDDQEGAKLLNAGILSTDEVTILNGRPGTASDFDGAASATAKVESILKYLKGVSDLKEGHYTELSTVNKIRYTLFFHFGLSTPRIWGPLNPSVEEPAPAPST